MEWRNRMKKTLCVILGLLMSLSVAACGKGPGLTEAIDPNRTQLYVFNYDGGVGTEWLYEIKDRFEAEYKDTCFEPGTNKMGVQIMIEANKLSFYNDEKIKSSPNEVFFTENVGYTDMVSQGLLLDITDLVTADENGVSLEDRMTDKQKEALIALKGKYYALPHYDGYRGVSYDIDLFEEKGLYFADEKDNGNNGFIISSSDKRSAGPDGKYGTNDDGLPSTMAEFFRLFDYMLSSNVTPFVYTGMYPEYTSYVVEWIYSNYAGADVASLDYTFDSGDMEVEIITGFEELKNNMFGAEPITEKVKIAPENGYLMKQQTGKYYGLAFLNKMVSDSRYYYSLSTNQTFSHLDAQEAFIYSKLENKPIAMLIDGSYWVNEAQGAFRRSIEDYGTRAENRNFGWMPLPTTVDGEVSSEQTGKNAAKDTVRSYAYINGNIADDENKVKLAKLFLSYCYKLENLQKFTEVTGCARGLNYELTEENKSQMSTFALSVWDMRQTTEMVRPISSSEIFMNNEKEFYNSPWESVVSNQPYVNPVTAFRNSISAMDYFNGMKIYKRDWEEDYSRWF